MKGRYEQFTVLIANINRCIRRIKTEEMKVYNLKSPHVSCLYYLYKLEPITAKRLCEICDEDKANISRTIKYLKENGYLLYDATAKKRYLTPIQLTKKGRETGKYIAERVDSVLNIAGAGMSEEERKILYRNLALINHNLQEICDQYEDK